MCEYCGCQQIAVIAQLTREHDAVVDMLGVLRGQLNDGALDAAAVSCRLLLTILRPHTQVEEQGLFPELTADYPDHVEVLREEHQLIEAVLTEALTDTPVDPAWPDRVHEMAFLLREHILKEQDGVFPAALGILDGDQWERIERVRALAGSPLPTPQARASGSTVPDSTPTMKAST